MNASRAAAAMLVLGVSAAVAGSWFAASSPTIALLVDRAPASWIVYPTPFDPLPRPAIELVTVFRRTFAGPAAGPATLRLRAFRSARVLVNGQSASLPDLDDWKAERTGDVARLLRPGENLIEVSVANDAGPPAAWIVLEMPGAILASDRAWQASLAGAPWRPAALAVDPVRGRRHDPHDWIPVPARALLAGWRLIALFAVLSGVLVAALRRVAGAGDRSPQGGENPWPARAMVACVAAAWAAMFLNNLRGLPLTTGFDAAGHLEYTQYVLDRNAVPFADEGWQMFQPPLYYAVMAALLRMMSASTSSAEALLAFRSAGLVMGLVHVGIVGAALHLLAAGNVRRQLAGLAVAAFSPCMLYMHQYPTNEILAAMLSSAALLAALRSFREEAPTVGRSAVIGVLLGLALLAKFSTLLTAAAVLGTLATRALLARRELLRRHLLGLGAAAAALLAVSAWYFARVHARFGTPFVGGWEARPQMAWWQDPGYRTAGSYARFGGALTRPIFAGVDGVWDGLYSTMWGDGLASGFGPLALAPPIWPASLMSAGYLLAILPTVAILVGFVAVAVAWFRRPNAGEGMLLGLAGLQLAAIAYMSLRVPSVVADKASYGLLSLVALCAFCGRGTDVLARAWRLLGWPLYTALGTWALTAYAALWIDESSAGVRMTRAMDLLGGGDAPAAVALLKEVIDRDPGELGARLLLADALVSTGTGSATDIERLLGADDVRRDMADRHAALALWAGRSGDIPRAFAEARRAVELEPNFAPGWALLARLSESAGATPEATRSWREVIRIVPHDPDAHAALARLLLAVEPATAEMHRRYAERR